METPLVSVIVPIYKIDKYVGICIESIINQTYHNLEIILVDDGSPDRCPEICDLYASKDSRIKVIHKKNGGLVSARKAGLEASTGTLIGYVDGDDWIGPGFYQSLVHSLMETDSDIAIAGFSRDLFTSTKNMLNSIPSGIYDGESLKQVYKKMLSNGPFYMHGLTTYLWNKLFKREMIIKPQMEVDDRITVGEDAAVVYKAILGSNRIIVTDNCAYHYRQREDSMLKTSSNYVEEYKRLKFLNECMSMSFNGEPKEYNLHEQLKEFITGTYIIRSGGCLENANDDLLFFPFSKDIAGKRVVVYGAGTFGQQLVKRIKNDGLCNLVGWIDSDYWEYRRCCMDVDPIESIYNMKYDYILIAILAPSSIDHKRARLLDYGVSREKILSISVSPYQTDQAYQTYLSKSIDI